MSRTSVVLKGTQIALATVWCFLAAGPIFGFAALKPILVSQGVYSNYCNDHDGLNKLMCVPQEQKLNAAFTYAAIAASTGAFLASQSVDRFGSRVSSGIGSTLLAIGALVLRTLSEDPASAKVPAIDAAIFGLSALAAGGPFIYISSLHLSKHFPHISGFVIALLTGAADASVGLFAIYRNVYEHSYRYSLRQVFSAYLIVPAVILFSQVVLMPSFYHQTLGGVRQLKEQSDSKRSRRAHRTEESSDRDNDAMEWDVQESETTRLLSNSLRNEDRYDDDEIDVGLVPDATGSARASTLNTVRKDPSEVSGVWGALHRSSANSQIKSPWFVLMVAFVGVQTVIINYFIATMPSYYETLLDSVSAASGLSQYFDVAFPIGSIAVIPFVEFAADSISTRRLFALLAVASVVIEILGVIPFVFVAQIRITAMVLFRPLLYTAVSDYVAKVFGFDTFSTVYGLTLLFSGLFNVLILPLDELRTTIFAAHPSALSYVLGGSSLIVSALLIFYLVRQTRRIRRKQLEEEAQSAPVLQMPGSNGCHGDGCQDCVCEV